MNRISSMRLSFLLTLFASLCLAGPAAAQSGAEPAPARDEVERGLLPAVVPAGRPMPRYTIEARMAHYKVPGVGVAVIAGGTIAWAAGYGLRAAGTTDSVTTETRFQAASISKPVAATAALTLVEEGRLDLDADINAYLTSWKVPENDFTAEQPVTLRGLVTHTAGLTVHGFPGYGAGDAVPTGVQVLDGAAPANTAPIRVDTTPGTRWRYSGGGYTVMQQMIEDVTGRPFANVLQERVLTPLGMAHSTYEQPLPARFAGTAATAHNAEGTPIDGRWHTYPEQAAAGLWTTPSDLARWAVALQQTLQGSSAPVLSTETARAMVTPGLGNWGLGPSVGGEDDRLYFSHGGSNEGFRCFLIAYAHTGRGVVVMTNGSNGSDLGMEIVRAVSNAYDWPDFKPEARAVVVVDAATLDRYIGTYQLQPDLLVKVTRGEDGLIAHAPGRPALALLPASETEFFATTTDIRLTFDASGAGPAGRMTVFMGNNEIPAVRVPDAH